MLSLSNLIISLLSAESIVVVFERGPDSQFLQCKTHIKEQFVNINYGGVDESIRLLMSG